ncbi:MAG: hypothetical protein NT007_12980 [Candidatus Kapabacteria bacterium]|nr:hypothetical protein [Candidatus Kapabacteria bacterium]
MKTSISVIDANAGIPMTFHWNFIVFTQARMQESPDWYWMGIPACAGMTFHWNFIVFTQARMQESPDWYWMGIPACAGTVMIIEITN